jgi:succinate dehydrogenase hydrophobic anchor subunit
MMAVIERHRTSPSHGPLAAVTHGHAWWWTVGTGIALVVLATVHMIAQHFVVAEVGGLRTYHQVIEYIANPWILTIECLFVLVVTIHAMLGVRSVLLDIDMSRRARRRVDVGLAALGTATVVYGFALILTLASRA